ncbi:MAG TPA: hypothetical protein EYH40_05570 [Desulfurococcales archaeon]|nr:hypothetical protein [Desulfurococcales archaeon]
MTSKLHNTNTICNVCHSRVAIYYRRESGEKLCLRCLESSILKRVTKCINKYTLLTPNDKIFYVFLPQHIYYSLYLLRVLLLIEKSFPTEIIVLAPHYIISEVMEYQSIKKFIVKEFNLNCEEAYDYLSLFLRELELIAEYAQKEGKIVLPLLLDDIVKLYILAILNMKIDFIGYLRPKFRIKESTFITPFRHIQAKELSLICYFKFPGKYVKLLLKDASYMKTPKCMVVDEIVNNIVRSHIELGFVIVERVDKLYRMVTTIN